MPTNRDSRLNRARVIEKIYVEKLSIKLKKIKIKGVDQHQKQRDIQLSHQKSETMIQYISCLKPQFQYQILYHFIVIIEVYVTSHPIEPNSSLFSSYLIERLMKKGVDVHVLMWL